MKNGFFAICISILAASCSLLSENDPELKIENPFLNGSGVFIMNEGNFMAGNGSVSFYSFDSSKVYNDLFQNINSRPLGDIPYSMTLFGDRAYVVINNSGKIEVVDRNTLLSIKTITGLDSPRNLLVVNNSKAYVTSLWSKKIAVIDIISNTVSGYIDIRRSSEGILLLNNKIYVSCWTSGSELMIIDPATDKIIDSVSVGHEPESMAVDKNKKIWVLCSGGYTGEYYPQLVRINTTTDEVENVIQFPSKSSYPSSLCINGTGDTIYYIDGGIRQMSINETSIPAKFFVPASGRLFYKLLVKKSGNGIFATNAVDYQNRGYLLLINGKGAVTDSARAGIIPGNMYFNQNLD